MQHNGQTMDDLQRRANELGQQRLVLRDQLFETWEKMRNLRGALRDVSAKQRAIDSEMRQKADE